MIASFFLLVRLGGSPEAVCIWWRTRRKGGRHWLLWMYRKSNEVWDLSFQCKKQRYESLQKTIWWSHQAGHLVLNEHDQKAWREKQLANSSGLSFHESPLSLFSDQKIIYSRGLVLSLIVQNRWKMEKRYFFLLCLLTGLTN